VDEPGHEEGWYKDPYGLHIDRWMSDGKPTRLVRDGDRESDDEPPASRPTQPLVRSLRVARRPEGGTLVDFTMPAGGVGALGSAPRVGGRLGRAVTFPLRRVTARIEKHRQSPESYADPVARSGVARTWLLNNGWDIRIEERHDLPPLPMRSRIAMQRPTSWYWVHLVSLEDPDCVFPDYSSAVTVEEAIIHAQARYAQQAKHGSGPAAARS
jgi:hypothetical protein